MTPRLRRALILCAMPNLADSFRSAGEAYSTAEKEGTGKRAMEGRKVR